MNLLYALLCDGARESSDERLDVSGIFRRLYAPRFPAEHEATLVLAIEWDAGEAGDQPFRLDLLDPSGSPVLTASGHTAVPEERAPELPPPLSRLVLPIERMIFPVPGRYEFELRIAGVSRRTSPVYLIHDSEADEGRGEASGS